MSNPFKKLLGEDNFERVRASLAPFFPDGEVTDEHVHAVVHTAWSSYRDEYGAMGIITPIEEWEEKVAGWWHGLFHKSEHAIEPLIGQVAKGGTQDTIPLYVARANHNRVMGFNTNAPFQSQFVKQLDMVRVRLPQTLAGDASDIIRTSIGDVNLGNDHLLGSLDMITERWGGPQFLGYAPGRVDLITTARYRGMRFATGTTLYLGYKNADDAVPTFYITEGGMPTGEPKAIYLGKTLDEVVSEPCGYTVTPFAAPENSYVFTLNMAPGAPDEPEMLQIKTIRKGETRPYLTAIVHYSRVANLTPTWAAEQLLEAGMRMSLLGNAMGHHVFGTTSPVQDAGAKISHTKDEWLIKPPLSKLSKDE